MDAARAARNAAAAAAALPQEYDDEPEYQPSAGASLASLRGPAAAVRPQPSDAAQQQQPQDYHEQLRNNTPTSRCRTRRATTTRCMAGSRSGEQDYQRDPAYPDDPYAYQGDYEEEPAPKKRSSGLMTVAAVLALAVVGTGAAFAYRTFVGSPRSGEPPIIRADNSPTKVVPAPSDAARQDARPHAAGRRRREAGVARRDAGRRQFEVRRAARGVSAAEPERQPAAGRERLVRRRRRLHGRQRHDAEQRAAQDQDARRQGRAADNGGIPAGASAPPPRPAPPTRSVAAPAARRRRRARNPASANASANAPMSLAPQGGTRSEPPTRVAATNPAQTAPAPAEAAAIWFRSPRRRTRPTRRPPTGRCRASSRACSAPVRR